MSKEDEQIDIGEKDIGEKDIGEKDKDFLKNKMLDLESQFKIMDQKMDKILEILEKDCKKMSDHIDFVENVYDNVKMPFYYVMDKVKCLGSNDNKKLLDCDHKNKNNNNNIEDK